MIGLIMTLLINNSYFEQIKNKSKPSQEQELTVDQKIEILAWRTEIMAQAILELDDKINYIINHYDYKSKTHVSNLLNARD